MFRVTWAICGCTFGSSFQRFCRDQLGLKQDISKSVVAARRDTGRLNHVEKRILERVDPKKEGTLKILLVTVKDRLDPNQSLALHAGFVLIKDNKIRYLRIQDHLRKMGLGTFLLKQCGPAAFELPSSQDDPADWTAQRFKYWAKRRGLG